jgi:exosortase E/protease (VPEID-CTERM system)
MGQAGHPAAAVYGFHSQAGWITFNAAAFGLAYVSHRSAWLRQAHANPRPAPGEGTENPTAYFLLPLLTILAAGVLAQAVSSGFETLYPIRVITGAAVLWLCRRRSTGLNWEFGWRGLSAGILVFLIWDLAAYLTVPWARMPSSLAAMSPGLRAVWITSRILGSVLIVPIAEELAYRGYLMRRLMSRDFESVSLRAVRWPAVIVSAIAFGLPHGVLWWPGIVAGVVFGVLAVRTGRIGEAVLAHATTNFLIAVAVVYWDQWQLW